MKIALIYPPYKHRIFSENLEVVDEEFCLAPPIILAYVAAILERSGHKVMLLDARALGLDKMQALDAIKKFAPDMLGFRSESYHFHEALDWIRFLKSNLGVPVFSGGPNLSLYPKETLSYAQIDYGIIGEAIDSLPELISALENEKSFSHIPGIAYKNKAGTVIVNEPLSKLVDLDSYPLPSRHLLPNDRYYSFISQRKNFTVMLTSTGCPFSCIFCAIPSVYRARTPGNVIREIEVCYKEYNIREIDFFDAVFFMNKDRAMELFYRLKRLNLDLEWSCRSRVDVVDKDILRAAAEAGCRQIYYGIESANQDILNKMSKRIVVENVKETVSLTRKYGIRTMGFFMIGNEGDTSSSVRKTMEFAKSIDLDFVQVCRVIAKPGTVLHRRLNEATGVDLWRGHILGDELNRRLPTPWSSLSEQETLSLTQEFYFKFYFRARTIFKLLFRLKSFKELRRYLRAGLKFILQR